MGYPRQPNICPSESCEWAPTFPQVRTEGPQPLTNITGRTVSLLLPPCDTPQDPEAVPPRSGSLPLAGIASDAAAVWRAITPSIAGTPHVRISRDGGRTYPARHSRPLPGDPPGQPCTVPVFDPGAGTGRMLALDLDLGRVGRDVDDRAVQYGHEHRADPAAEVAAQAVSIAELVTRCGGQVLADVSPSGGRHVYILFAAALPWRELRDLGRATALRFPAVDPAPMSSMGGQISPPGSRHKSGGWRLLSTPLSEARAAVEHPNGPGVWSALLTEFAAELQQLEQPRGGTQQVDAELDDAGIPWVPRLGGRAPLGVELDRAARTGHTRGRGRSEARMAILCAAAARGWRLADVLEAIRSGRWKGFPGLYERRSEPDRMARLLPLEWRKAITFVSGEKNPSSLAH